jgi:hypothetical protein
LQESSYRVVSSLCLIFISRLSSCLSTGRCRLYQERIWQKVQPNLVRSVLKVYFESIDYYPICSFPLTRCLQLFLCHRHVIVGRNFGSYVTHETKHFIYFYLGQVAILLFKSG